MSKMECSSTSTLIDYMSTSIGNENDPRIGIFWYLPKENKLFGVLEDDPSDRPFNMNGDRTIKRLHYQHWAKQKAKGEKGYVGDYTMVPRGRVWENEKTGFFVTVGSWIHEYPQAKELIIAEFDLPSDVEFRENSHWDIGSGWEGDRL